MVNPTPKIPQTPAASGARPLLQRLLSMLLVLVLLLGIFPSNAFASWDGSGNTDGNTGVSNVSGGFKMEYADATDIYGYRFSVYDAQGNKLGYSIDIMFKTDNAVTYRSSYTTRKSHTDLYSRYLSTGNASIGTLISLQVTTSGSSANKIYFDSTLPSTPTAVESWMEATTDRCQTVAGLCGATYDATKKHFFVIEPLIRATLSNLPYCMTMADYAVYQASEDGVNSWTDVPSSYVESSYMTLMRQLSAYFGRYLYAEQEYPQIFDTEPIPSYALRTDAQGTDSVLIRTSGNLWHYYNTAEDVLQYQMGMAIYTDSRYSINYHANDGSGDVEMYAYAPGDYVTIYDPEDLGFSVDREFLGWSVSENGTYDEYGWTGWSGNWNYTNGQYGISGDTLNLYAIWGEEIEQTYTIYYHPNGGTGSTVTQTITAGQSITLYDYGDCGFSRTGYKPLESSGSTSFSGREYWTTNSSGAYDANGWFGSWSGKILLRSWQDKA